MQLNDRRKDHLRIGVVGTLKHRQNLVINTSSIMNSHRHLCVLYRQSIAG